MELRTLPIRATPKPERLAVVFSMFIYGGWMHLLGNIWFLWIFGNNVEDHLGKARYVVFYLLGGIVATIAHIAVQPDSIVPVAGASGAAAATMGAYAVWFPNAPIRTLLFIVLSNVKAKWWLAFRLVSQFFIGAHSQVAWMAHVGGFVFGSLVALVVRDSPAAAKRAFTQPYQFDGTGPRCTAPLGPTFVGHGLTRNWSPPPSPPPTRLTVPRSGTVVHSAHQKRL